MSPLSPGALYPNSGIHFQWFVSLEKFDNAKQAQARLPQTELSPATLRIAE